MNILSPGEITKGMIIASYETLEQKQPNPHAIMGMVSFGGEEEKEKFELNMTPWYKGYPFRILDIAGPLITVKTYEVSVGGKKLTPLLVFDKRLTRFVEINQEYYVNFWAALGVDIIKQEMKDGLKTTPAPIQEMPPKLTSENVIVEGSLEQKIKTIEDYKKKHDNIS